VNPSNGINVMKLISFVIGRTRGKNKLERLSLAPLSIMPDSQTQQYGGKTKTLVIT